MAGTNSIPRPIRRIIARLATVVCPPELQARHRHSALLAEFARYLGALPPHWRVGILVAFVLFDQRARLYRPAHGRRFVALDPARADAYFCHLVQGSNARDRALLGLLQGLITFCYYELPAAQAEIGYQPGPYVARVAARRWAMYEEDIRRGEAAVFADDPPASEVTP